MNVNEALAKYENELDRKERVAHRDALLAIAEISKTDTGQKLIKYLFKSFSVNQLPEMGLEGLPLHDRLGYLRAGEAIFDMVSEADSETAAQILAKIKREQYEDRLERYRIETGLVTRGRE